MKFKLSTRNKILLGILILLIPLFLFSLLRPKKVIAWFNDNWSYRARIPITAHTSTESNRYYDFTLDTSGSGKFQSDCGDLRFMTQAGTLLQYRITSGCGTGSTTARVYFATFPSGAQDLYYYYGNATAANGFVASDVYATVATNVTVGSIGSEEKGPGPMAYWKFDEGDGSSVYDSVRNNATGTLSSGASFQTSEYCISGSCLYFDGTTNGKVTVSGGLSLANQSFSYSYWAKWQNTGNLVGMINQGPATTDNGFTAAFMPTNVFRFAFWGDDLDTTMTFSANTWYHISGTYDASTNSRNIYINGKLAASDTASADYGGSGDMCFGVGCTGDAMNASPFQGFLDEIKFYNYVRSTDEIKTDYASYAGGSVGATLGSSSLDSLSDGLVGYWKMDEKAGWTVDCSTTDVLDSSGNGYDGAACPTSTGPSGANKTAKYAFSGDFDGSDDYVTVATPETLGTSYTFAMWIYPETVAASPLIVYYDNPLNAHMGIDATGTLRGVAYDAASGSWPLYEIYTTNVITANTWQHVAFTVDGVNLKLYVNGERVAEKTIASTATAAFGDEVRFGNYPWYGAFYDGKMDEVRVYNRALDDKEIRSLYNWAPGPVGWWKLDEGVGATTAVDSSGRGHDGTHNGLTRPGTPGKYGNAAFIGYVASNTDYITIADDDDFSVNTTNEFSVSYWIRLDTAATGWNYPVHRRAGGNYEWDVILNPTTNQVECKIMQSSSTNILNTAPSTSIIRNTWYYLTMTVDLNSNTLYCYKNGILIGSDTTASGTYTNGTSTLRIGSGPDGAGFQGVIDDVKIYNYVRTPAEILEDMNGGHPVGGSPIGSQVGYWKFDEMTENTCANGSNDVCNSTSYSSTLDGTSTASRTTSGKINGALNFDGSTNVVTIANTNEIDLDVNLNDGFTFSGWINPDTVGEGTGGQVFQKGSNTYCQLSGSDPFTLTCNLDYVTTDANAAVSSAIPAGSWTYVAMTFNSADDTISVWINGTKRSTSSAGTGGKSSDTSNLLIGGGTSNNFDGKIDEFKIYNSTLSQEEILVDMNANAAISVANGLNEESDLEGGAGTGPVGWWKFDDNKGTTTIDSSGNANNGTLTNMTSNQWVFGREIPHYAGLDFVYAGGSGTDDYVNIPASALYNFTTGSFTIMGWVKPDTSPFSGRLMGYGYFFTTPGYNIEVYSGASTWQFNAGDPSAANTTMSIYTGTDILAVSPTYYHLAGVVDRTNNRMILYINGIPQSITEGDPSNCGDATPGYYLNISACTTIDTDPGSSQPFYIGAYGGYGGFDGKIDDVKIYDYGRSTDQIWFDMYGDRPIAWWKFDECEGSSAYDAVSNSYTGTLTPGGSGNTAAGTCNSGTSTHMRYNGRTGKFGSALDFDGTNDYVTIADNENLEFNEFLRNYSLFAWIKRDATGAMNVLSKEDADNDGWRLFITSGNVVQCSVDSVDVTGSTTITDSNWHHVGCTIDREGNGQVYLDGRADGSATAISSEEMANSNPLFIGARSYTTASGNYFNGLIDDVRIYPYALSASGVKMVMNEGSAARFGPETGPTP